MFFFKRRENALTLNQRTLVCSPTRFGSKLIWNYCISLKDTVKDKNKTSVENYLYEGILMFNSIGQWSEPMTISCILAFG
jgi:hypothetical protein